MFKQLGSLTQFGSVHICAIINQTSISKSVWPVFFKLNVVLSLEIIGHNLKPQNFIRYLKHMITITEFKFRLIMRSILFHSISIK